MEMGTLRMRPHARQYLLHQELLEATVAGVVAVAEEAAVAMIAEVAAGAWEVLPDIWPVMLDQMSTALQRQ